MKRGASTREWPGSIDIFLVCLIILVALVLCVSEKLRVDLVATLIMADGHWGFRDGFVSPQEGISGFSNAATITIAVVSGRSSHAHDSLKYSASWPV